MDILETLELILRERINADADNSYVAGLYAKGLDHILQKVGEESVELIIAAKHNYTAAEGKSKVVHESADLLFHLLVLLAHLDIPLSSIAKELERRSGVSGLVEKTGRTAS